MKINNTKIAFFFSTLLVLGLLLTSLAANAQQVPTFSVPSAPVPPVAVKGLSYNKINSVVKKIIASTFDFKKDAFIAGIAIKVDAAKTDLLKRKFLMSANADVKTSVWNKNKPSSLELTLSANPSKKAAPAGMDTLNMGVALEVKTNNFKLISYIINNELMPDLQETLDIQTDAVEKQVMADLKSELTDLAAAMDAADLEGLKAAKKAGDVKKITKLQKTTNMKALHSFLINMQAIAKKSKAPEAAEFMDFMSQVKISYRGDVNGGLKLSVDLDENFFGFEFNMLNIDLQPSSSSIDADFTFTEDKTDVDEAINDFAAILKEVELENPDVVEDIADMAEGYYEMVKEILTEGFDS